MTATASRGALPPLCPSRRSQPCCQLPAVPGSPPWRPIPAAGHGVAAAGARGGGGLPRQGPPPPVGLHRPFPTHRRAGRPPSWRALPSPQQRRRPRLREPTAPAAEGTNGSPRPPLLLRGDPGEREPRRLRRKAEASGQGPAEQGGWAPGSYGGVEGPRQRPGGSAVVLLVRVNEGQTTG